MVVAEICVGLWMFLQFVLIFVQRSTQHVFHTLGQEQRKSNFFPECCIKKKIYIYICICMYVCVFVYVCMYVCMHVYTPSLVSASNGATKDPWTQQHA